MNWTWMLISAEYQSNWQQHQKHNISQVIVVCNKNTNLQLCSKIIPPSAIEARESLSLNQFWLIYESALESDETVSHRMVFWRFEWIVLNAKVLGARGEHVLTWTPTSVNWAPEATQVRDLILPVIRCLFRKPRMKDCQIYGNMRYLPSRAPFTQIALITITILWITILWCFLSIVFDL